MARPALKRPVIAYLRDHYGLSRRRACRLVRLHRSTSYYRSIKDPRLELRSRMRELARARVRFGYRRLQVLLRREGWTLGKNLAYRVYCEEGLQLRSKLPRRRKMMVTRRERFVPRRANEAWSMDFVADQLADGRRFRALTIVDVFSREALAIEVGQSLRGEDVAQVCNQLVARRGAPKRVLVDNGSEFSGRTLDLWAYHHGVQIDFSRPGKPTDNCFIETFNGSLRDECLNVHWFESVEEAKEKIEAWRCDYNESRPHQALRELTPSEFASRAKHLEGSMGLQTAGSSL
jgi:putative transposase